MTWKTLQHPNVLPLIGVTASEAHFAMVSEWMANGNVNEFVKENPDANRLKLVGSLFHIPHHPFSPGSLEFGQPIQLEGVARGLIYIHHRGMIHGDLKGVGF